MTTFAHGYKSLWQSQNNQKGVIPANGTSPNFYSLKNFYRTPIIKYNAETKNVSALYLYKGLRLTQSCGSFLDHFFCTEDDVLDNCSSRFNLLDKSGTFAGHVAAVDVAFLYSLA